MEIEEFRESMQKLSDLADTQGKQLRVAQVRDLFPDLETEQRTLILRYLKTKGIAIAGEDEPDIENGNGADFRGEQEASLMRTGKETPSAQMKKGAEDNPCLTEKDRAWLARYKEELAENSEASASSAGDGNEDPRLRRFLPAAAELAAEFYRDGMNLADLVQEANLALLTILAGDSAQLDDEEILRRLRKGVREAANEQDEQNFGDETLVAKVRNLEAVMKDLTEDGGDPKFTVEELAIMLDMDIDEMKDIIRLTGEGD